MYTRYARSPLTRQRTALLPAQPLSTSTPVRHLFAPCARHHALERVAVAHVNSYRPGASGTGPWTGGRATTDPTDDKGGTVVSLSNGMAPAYTVPASLAAREAFYFRNVDEKYAVRHCVLCHEDVEHPATPRQHLLSVNRGVPNNHVTYETCLDHLALLAMRGYPIDAMYEVWSDVLYHHDAFPRVRALVSPRWGIARRAAVLRELLATLRDSRVIDLCLTSTTTELSSPTSVYLRRHRAFERLEYIGDCSWGENMAQRMMVLMPDRQWQYSKRAFDFNVFRDTCEMNITLEYIFDKLQLASLLPSYSVGRLGPGKIKADFLEALLGELHVTVFGLAPAIYDDVAFIEVNGLHEGRVCALVQHCITEIYDLIILSHLSELIGNALPLAKEVAARTLWLQTKPAVNHSKTRRPYSHIGVATARDASATSGQSHVCGDAPDATRADGIGPRLLSLTRTTVLPALPGLFTSAQPYPRHVPHPLISIPAKELLPCTVCDYTNLDVFAPLHASFDRLQLLTSDARDIFETLAQPPTLDPLLEQLVPTLASCNAAALNSREVYCEDPYYSLQPTPLARVRPESDRPNSPDAALELARGMCQPALQSAPTLDEASAALLADARGGWPVCLYAASRYVPRGVKPPTAGVVTERNLYRGQFAYLGYTSPQQQHVKPAGDDGVIDSAANDGADVDDGAASLDARVSRAQRAIRLKWQKSNPYFFRKGVTALGGLPTPATAASA